MRGHTWFHVAAWGGLAATVYTNYKAAPVAELQVGYLAVPAILAAVSEGLIATWHRAPRAARYFMAAITFALAATSYEHFVHIILTRGGTPFAAWFGGGVIDASIFGCVLMTAVLRKDSGIRSGIAPKPESDIPVSVIPESLETGNGHSEIPESLDVDVPELLTIPESPTAPRADSGIAPTLFTEPPATEVDGPTAPVWERAFVDATVEDFAPSVSAPRSPRPTSGARAAKHATEMQLMHDAFGGTVPTGPEVMNRLGKSSSVAYRLVGAYADHLEQNSEQRS